MPSLRRASAIPRLRSHRHAVSAGDNGGDDAIFFEIFRALDRQELREFRSGSIHPALDRAGRASAYLRCLVIGKARGSDHDEHLALPGLELVQGRPELVAFRMRDLRRLRDDAVGVVLDGLERFATPAAFREEVILHDRAEPSEHIGARRERHDVCACAKQRVLNKVVGVVAIPAKRNGESAKPRHRCQHRRSDGRLKRSDLFIAGTIARGGRDFRLAIKGG